MCLLLSPRCNLHVSLHGLLRLNPLENHRDSLPLNQLGVLLLNLPDNLLDSPAHSPRANLQLSPLLNLAVCPHSSPQVYQHPCQVYNQVEYLVTSRQVNHQVCLLLNPVVILRGNRWEFHLCILQVSLQVYLLYNLPLSLLKSPQVSRLEDQVQLPRLNLQCDLLFNRLAALPWFPQRSHQLSQRTALPFSLLRSRLLSLSIILVVLLLVSLLGCLHSYQRLRISPRRNLLVYPVSSQVRSRLICRPLSLLYNPLRFLQVFLLCSRLVNRRVSLLPNRQFMWCIFKISHRRIRYHTVHPRISR